MKQITLKGEFTLSGKGLHTGAHLNATFCPAPDNHGYKIQRIDLDDAPIIDAVAENVSASTRGT
ncbi:MAG: UDP-3-O-acyl-N-acetylglucosamine deacetylase, partial [Muribaculaceae bacterium]|nr:UDP-3-O-acyl-N-acetylglucosamine deacetylase [Muribaculaceae bacterium]